MFSSSRYTILGRILLIAITVLFLWALFARESGASRPPSHYTVKPGDTLWSIAVERYGGDPREGVWRVEQANRLPSGSLSVGQQLVLP